jgi:hypothetical protein
MKSITLTLFLATMLHIPAHAAGTKIPACQAPFAACQAAGYVVGAHKKGDKEGTDNGLWVDCIDAVADGKKQVNGVDKSAAQACKAAQKAKKGH